MGGAWCLPCAGRGGGGVGGKGGGISTSDDSPEITRKLSCIQKQHQLHQVEHPVTNIQQRAPLSDLDEDLDELEGERDRLHKEEDYSRDGTTQHRLSPRLHDIEEEDDEEGRHIKER